MGKLDTHRELGAGVCVMTTASTSNVAPSHDRWSRSAFALPAICLAAVVVGCVSPEGGDGEPCNGSLDCDPGLICNTGNLTSGLYTCQRPESVREDGACDPDAPGLCAVGLVCSFTSASGAPWTCEPPRPCPAGQAYSGGDCMPCPPGTACDGACTVCSGLCVGAQSDSNNCGGCGTVCPIEAPTCQSGTCTCPWGTVCSGVCVNEQNNVSNCGACGNSCPGTSMSPAICQAGVCTQEGPR
jgi:hypothetical protein